MGLDIETDIGEMRQLLADPLKLAPVLLRRLVIVLHGGLPGWRVILLSGELSGLSQARHMRTLISMPRCVPTSSP